MRLVDDVTKPGRKKKATPPLKAAEPAYPTNSIKTAASLLENIVEIACEREPDLDLMRLINFLDLYRVYVETVSQSCPDRNACLYSFDAPSETVLTQNLGETGVVSFERFVRNSHLLSIAANAASAEVGERVSVPAPLSLSANQ